jgi:hypothetical protein
MGREAKSIIWMKGCAVAQPNTQKEAEAFGERGTKEKGEAKENRNKDRTKMKSSTRARRKS